MATALWGSSIVTYGGWSMLFGAHWSLNRMPFMPKRILRFLNGNPISVVVESSWSIQAMLFQLRQTCTWWQSCVKWAGLMVQWLRPVICLFVCLFVCLLVYMLLPLRKGLTCNLSFALVNCILPFSVHDSWLNLTTWTLNILFHILAVAIDHCFQDSYA